MCILAVMRRQSTVGSLGQWVIVSMVLGADVNGLGAVPVSPYEQQVAEQLQRVGAELESERAAGAEALGLLRAYTAEPVLIELLADRAVAVRRQAAMALAWCGGRPAIVPLLNRLRDTDWVTRQAAHAALTNLTGMEFPFDALATAEIRADQEAAWRSWWKTVPDGEVPASVGELLAGPVPWAARFSVRVSSTYRGPPAILGDGELGPAYWQTKNVPFPQWCELDLRAERQIFQVTVHQYGPKFVMTDYAVEVSRDGKRFEEVAREQRVSPVVLVVNFAARPVRFVRVTSYGSKNAIYPTTFFEITLNDEPVGGLPADQQAIRRMHRGLRAVGALGGRSASALVRKWLGPAPMATAESRPLLRSAIRSWGRLRDPESLPVLLGWLDDVQLARYAADALGEFGDPMAMAPLLAAYRRYAKRLDGTDPPDVPPDDKMGFPSEDRMLETAYEILLALSRFSWSESADIEQLRAIGPLLVANLPGDHDAMMLYEPEVGHLLTRYLLDRSDQRQSACEHALQLLGQPRRLPADGQAWPEFAAYRVSSWLPTVCTERADIPRLVALLDHESGWVRLNAAKTLAWIGDPVACAPIARRLAEARPEAAFGYSGVFKDEEYNDPAPRWREGLIRALGQLHAHDQTERLISILNDDQSVLEVRHAAAEALGDLGNERALAALERAALLHPFHSVRNIAWDACRRAGRTVRGGFHPDMSHAHQAVVTEEEVLPTGGQASPSADWDTLVFIKGDNDLPNTKGTVEQADRWRQTYVVTDSGPVYRPGNNLYLLSPPAPEGRVTALTRFADGYVGDLEVAWDASHVLFCRRERDNPWWHIYRVNRDGTELRQLTRGPYHHVGPAYLPDGRIVFATSRAGIRDEYHAYPCTALWVMNADGTDMHPISTNIGRDNEPAILADGRIVTSRLEVFYSRNKTELTIHALHPDGTRDIVLYGPERRPFWRNLDHGPPTPADGQEAPLTHRVLRPTQPQPMPNGRDIVVVTQGGLALIGPRRDGEAIITPDNKRRSYTTPYPLPDGRILCGSTLKTSERTEVDLGLYCFDPASQRLELIYNDPAAADFEARPLLARPRPVRLPENREPDRYDGFFACASVLTSQLEEVRQAGRFVRLIEGVPVVARHSTHTNDWPVWQNHGGTLARILGTVPLAADGSFYLQLPADRLVHLQVLDSDRRVVGNQLTWIYARPGEHRTCVGCHENPHTAPHGRLPLALTCPPINCLPDGLEFKYRAKAWFKGHLPAEIEERTRTVRSVNLIGR